MKAQAILMLILLIIILLFDLYSHNSLLALFKTQNQKVIFTIIYFAVTALVFYGFYRAYSDWQSDEINRSLAGNLLLGFAFSVFVGKMIFIGMMGVQDVGRLIIGAGNGLISLFGESSFEGNMIPSRRKFLTLAATSIAAVPFVSMLYGITKGKYNFTVNKLTLSFKDLPKAFDGFKIVQISDIHAGSFDCDESVTKGIDLIQEQQADMIVFTGDLVNEHKDEINPYIDNFKRLSAPYGKYAILGNHDYYGSYKLKESDHKAYWEDFKEKFRSMDFDLMLNENRYVEKGSDRISLVGVENWGAGKWFQKYGDLDKAADGTNGEDFRVLLSHDPTHWDEQVVAHPKKFHLTLSGHTHGMQFGINIPGFQWSPVKYQYKRWMGLYEEFGQYLYVNRGFGFLGFPGRVGMWPEITVLELKTA